MGTPTFLFTDIEGSTRRWEAQPVAMALALAHHDALLREAIATHGGAVFKTVGDAFCAVFAAPEEAVAAAIAAQGAVSGEDWSVSDTDFAPLTVRMALHTGEVEARDGDFFGPPLNRVARLLAAGHGGQVLVSGVVRAALAGSEPPGVGFRDLGEHRLKDLARPEHIYQLLASGLAADFPPLASIDTRPNNLPLQPNPLLGRERELADITQILTSRASRLVTLTGPGGTGKTRLAIQVAAEALDAFPHGVFFVDLAALSDPGLVAPTIAGALGLIETPGESITDTLTAWLAGKRLLLVMDNFEQILPAAPLVADLLAACPGLAVVVTSRAVLRLRWEHEYSVAPMPVPPEPRAATPESVGQYAAVQLFVARARAARRDFCVTTQNAPAIAEICVRLDGLPLAIELAAARVRALSAPAILERLDQRLRLLTAGARDLPARQQTMRQAISWSYELLDEREQRLFRGLGVFAGGWTLGAAEAACVADDELGVAEGLMSLVEKSLVRQNEGADGEPRYGMLETIREYALEQLAATGELDIHRHRHARVFATLARQAGPELGRHDQRLWIERLEADLDNLRAMFAWAREHEPDLGLEAAFDLEHWWWKGNHLAEGGALIQALLGCDGVSERATAMGLVVRGRIVFAAGDCAAAASDGAAALAIFEGMDSDSGAVRALSVMMYASWINAGEEEVLSLMAHYRRLAEAENDDVLLADYFAIVGLRLSVAGDLVDGRHQMEESLRLYRAVGNQSEVAWTLNNLGLIVMLPLGELPQAERYLVEALSVARGLGTLHIIAGVQDSLGRLQIQKGDLSAARESFAAGLKAGARGGSREKVWQNFEGLALVEQLSSRPERATTILAAADTCELVTAEVRGLYAQAQMDAEIISLRAVMGDAAFETAWATGEAMSLDEAVAFALADAVVAAPDGLSRQS